MLKDISPNEVSKIQKITENFENIDAFGVNNAVGVRVTTTQTGSVMKMTNDVAALCKQYGLFPLYSRVIAETEDSTQWEIIILTESPSMQTGHGMVNGGAVLQKIERVMKQADAYTFEMGFVCQIRWQVK